MTLIVLIAIAAGFVLGVIVAAVWVWHVATGHCESLRNSQALAERIAVKTGIYREALRRIAVGEPTGGWAQHVASEAIAEAASRKRGRTAP